MSWRSKREEKELIEQQEKAMALQKKKEQLLAMTEKELMVEMILRMDEISNKCDVIRRTIHRCC